MHIFGHSIEFFFFYFLLSFLTVLLYFAISIGIDIGLTIEQQATPIILFRNCYLYSIHGYLLFMPIFCWCFFFFFPMSISWNCKWYCHSCVHCKLTQCYGSLFISLLLLLFFLSFSLF